MTKKELIFDKKAIKFVMWAIFIPLVFTFILEHFGKFTATGLGSIKDPNAMSYKLMDTRLQTRGFNTVFGNRISKNLYSKNIPAYRQDSKGVHLISPIYPKQIPYYIEAVWVDKVYPLSLSLILIIVFFLNQKYRIKLV